MEEDILPTPRQVKEEEPNPQFDTVRLLRPMGFYGSVEEGTVRIPGVHAQTAGLYTAPFFIAERTYELIEVFERHETAGSDVGAVTVMVKKVPSGTAPGSGTDMLTAGIDLKATANLPQKGTVTTVIANRRIVRGDSLALVSTGTLTAVVGVTVRVVLKAI